MHHVGSIQVLPNQKKPSIRLKILTYESPMHSYIKYRVKLWDLIQFKGQKSVSTVFLRALTNFRCTLHRLRLQKWKVYLLTLFDMGFFEPSVMERDMMAPHHNFVAIAPMITKFGTVMKLHVFYTMETKSFVISLLLRNYDVITCILADP